MIRIRAAAALVIALLAASVRAGDFEFDEPGPVPNTWIAAALHPQPGAPEGGMVFMRLDIAKDGTQSLTVRGLQLPQGDYDVSRGGFGELPIGTLVAGPDGEATLAVEPPEFDDFFIYASFQLPVLVRQNGALLFTGALAPPGGGLVLDDPEKCTNGARFIAVGDDLDARGEIVYHSKFGSRGAEIGVQRLAPGPYVLAVNGTPQLLFDVSASGSAAVKLVAPLSSGKGQMDLYFAGDEVTILSHGVPVLAAQLPYDPFEELSQPAGKQKFKSVGKGAVDGLLAGFVSGGSTGGFGPEAGTLTWQRDAAGQVTLTVSILQDFIPSHDYELFVDGQFLSTLQLVETPTLQAVIPVDPLTNPVADLRGRRVEVRYQNATGLVMLFPRSVPAAVRAYHAEVRKPTSFKLDLLNPGADLDATGRITWKSATSGEKFTVQVADLPAGAYDIAIDGSVVAASALLVPVDGGGAKTTFSSTGSPKNALPLDFEVSGLLQIVPHGAMSPVLLYQELGTP